MRGKFLLRNQTVLMIWKGEDLNIGQDIGQGMSGCSYNSVREAQLRKKGVKFTNRFVDVYPFPGHYAEPRDCQREMLDFSLRHKRKYDLSEMRTGKSNPVAQEILIDRKYNGLKRFVIFAPLSTLQDTWETELFGTMPSVPVYYSTARGTKPLKEALKRGKYQIFVINFDKMRYVLNELLLFNPQSVYVDEASDFNDKDTQKYKALSTLMSDSKRKFKALTGTPTPNRPTDVWAIARLINPNTPKTWGALRNKTMTKDPYSQYKWTEKEGAQEIIANLMQPSIRFRTDDVNDMPSHEGMDVHTHMTPKQEQMYEDMRKHMIAEDAGKTLTAVHAGAKIWKLLQIASGVCYDEDGVPLMIGAKPKIQEVKRLIREASGKTVIMCPFTSVQKYIIQELRGDYKIGLINGKVGTETRKHLINQFQEGDLDVMLMHPRPTKYGLKLHAASQMIWFGPVYSSLEFEQGSARIRGPHTGKTVYIKLSASKLERDIYELIEQRMQNQQNAMAIATGLKQVYSTLLES